MWTDELFHVKKPIIALLHLRALPGILCMKKMQRWER